MQATGSDVCVECFQRDENFIESAFEQDLMIMHVKTRETVILNATAMAVWESLKWPQTIDSLSSILQEAFPDQSRVTLSHQVAEVVNRLRSRGLVVRLGDS